MKFLKYLIIAIVFIFLLGISLKALFNNFKKRNISPENASKPQVTLQENEQKSFRSNAVFSPDGNYLVYISGKKNGPKNWDITLTLAAQNLNYEVEGMGYYKLGGWIISDEDSAWEHNRVFRAAWSNDGMALAVVLPGRYFIRRLRFYETRYGDDNISYTHKVLGIRESIDGNFDGSLESISKMTSFYLFNIYFSKNAEELFLTTDSEVYMVWPEKKMVYKGDDKSMGFYPLSDGAGFTFFRQLQGYYGKYELVIIKEGKESVYKTPIRGADFAGDILMSPDLSYVCAEKSSSGHHGYIIFRVSSIEASAEGQQYSYCVKWLEGNKVLVRENPYFYQWTQQYFIINARSGKREFVGQVE